MNNHSSDGLCHVPITIEENQLNEGAWLILKAIRPHWEKNQLNFKVNMVFSNQIYLKKKKTYVFFLNSFFFCK